VSLVNPMLKQGKDRSDLNSYRPIALSNCIAKLLEKIVNKRLVWYLEHKKILSKSQSGFRRGMSTEDHIAYLQDVINKVLAVKQHLIAVFVDFTKAFDRVWRTGLFIRLRATGIRGNMFRYIRYIFKHTFLRVELEGLLSRLYEICNGILEGSVISPTLSILLIDAINTFMHDITLLLFADDTTLVKAGTNVNFIVVKLQEALDALVKWCDTWGFRISVEKTTAVLFTNYHCSINNKLTIRGVPIPVANSFKFLGVMFDRRLTWAPHIQYLKTKTASRLNLLSRLTATGWGASALTLLILYNALIKSVIMYGCVAFADSNGSSWLDHMSYLHSALE
jgi:hypothetical protein